MSTPPNSTSTSPPECPLHSAMRELALWATAQHVFYLEGECLPRPELLTRLQTWSLLHQVVSSRLCPATRDTPLREEELESTLGLLRSRMRYPDPFATIDAKEEAEGLWQRTLSMCEVCARATSCPLHQDASGGGTESRA